jgi:dipeptidyl-peptidase-4
MSCFRDVTSSFTGRIRRRRSQRSRAVVRAALTFVVAVAVRVAAPTSVAAQPRAPFLSIERIVTGAAALTGTSPSSPTWSPSSQTVAFLWNDGGQGGRTIWVVDRAGTVPRRLLPPENSAPVSALRWTPDGAALLFLQRNQLWRVPSTGGEAMPLTTTAGEIAEFALSPDGQQLSFLRDGDLWLLPVRGGAPTRVTSVAVAPIGTVPLGTYFRREVEIGGATWSGPSPSYAWSPDSKTIALQQVDRRGVRPFGMPYYLGDTTLTNLVRRGAPGAANEVRTVRLYDVTTGALTTVSLADSSSTRTVNLEWSPTGMLLIDRESDDAIERRLFVLTAAAPMPRQIWRDVRASRVYNDIASTWSADGKSVLMTSDLDDRYRVYRITPGDTTAVPLTPASADVAGVAMPNAAARSIDYVSTAPRPSERHLFRVSVTGGPARQLTTRAGTHTPFVSPDGRTVALLSSSDTEPTELYLLETRAGATERRITTSPTAAFAAIPWVAPRYVTFSSRTGGAPLHARIVFPPRLDSTRKYPVLFGPVYSNTVRNRWGGANGMLQQHLAIDKGYIVVQVDVRGSTGYGRAFREQFLMDWGGGDLEDLESAVMYLKSLPFVDARRFGIWGSSYGGTLTVYSLLKKPGLFQAGVAAAAAVDPFLFGSDDVAIVRRPQTHPAAFTRGAKQHAGNLRDHLLLIHGMQDDVVPFASVVALAEEFMRLGKDFDFAFAPAATHGWTQRPYYATYLLNKLVGHFDRYLGAGPQ